MKTTVVIPNYNGLKFLEDCMESLRAQTFRDFEVLIIDNASSDGSVEFLRSNYPEARLIVNETNLGFSGAVNIGIRESHSPYVLLLNNDVKADPGFVGELTAAIERSPKIFSVASRMMQMYHPDKLDSAGDYYNLLGWAVNRGVDESPERYMSPCQTFTACAGAAIYRKSVFEKIGYFDEMHFAYLEDIDVGYRARIYGYKNLYCPSAVVYHVGSGTSGSKYNSFKVKLSARNNIYLNYKNQTDFQLFVNFPALALGTFVKYLFFVKKGFANDYLEGIREGLNTRYQCRRVPYENKNFFNYLDIELKLISNTFRYVYDWIKRHA